MEWTVVTVIIALVGLFLTLGKPIINLNRAITKLDNTVDSLQEYQKKQDSRIDSHSAKLDDHEKRITVLEVHDSNNSKEK